MENSNRPIRFRAWDKEGKKMYPVLGISFRNGIVDIGREDSNKVDVELMQFTGLLDSKGVEIYEGDIVRGEAGNIDSIVSKEGAFCWGNMTLRDYYVGNWKVIGNVWENHNLLK